MSMNTVIPCAAGKELGQHSGPHKVPPAPGGFLPPRSVCLFVCLSEKGAFLKSEQSFQASEFPIYPAFKPQTQTQSGSSAVTD